MTEDGRVVMWRPLRPPLPVYPPPPGLVIRHHQPGDAALWTELQRVADTLNTITDDLFQQQYGTDAALHADRIIHLGTTAGETIGTSSAWFGPGGPGDPLGRVHWVAIHPDHQGRGLAHCLMAATLARLMGLGHREAYLTTSRERPVALRLYERHGFRELTADEATRRHL